MAGKPGRTRSGNHRRTGQKDRDRLHLSSKRRVVVRLVKGADIRIESKTTNTYSVGLGKALLGSVAEQILRQSPCPVLTNSGRSSPS
ncbi:MAG: hypothetical protein DMG51_07190 [Acidobacteria bacterium]|nr:MAG: hypothetical protein DMG51_07190 [Acidobacteriota bacterium]